MRLDNGTHNSEINLTELWKAKQSYLNNISRSHNSKQFWAAIKLLNGSHSSQIPTLFNNGETVTEDKKENRSPKLVFR